MKVKLPSEIQTLINEIDNAKIAVQEGDTIILISSVSKLANLESTASEYFTKNAKELHSIPDSKLDDATKNLR